MSDAITLDRTELTTDDGLDWRHIACKCRTWKTGLCGADLTGRTRLGRTPPEDQQCPLCIVLYRATAKCPACGRNWRGDAL